MVKIIERQTTTAAAVARLTDDKRLIWKRIIEEQKSPRDKCKINEPQIKSSEHRWQKLKSDNKNREYRLLNETKSKILSPASSYQIVK